MMHPANAATELAAFAWYQRAGELDAESEEAFRAGDEEKAIALSAEAEEALGVASHLLCALDRSLLPSIPRLPDPIGLA